MNVTMIHLVFKHLMGNVLSQVVQPEVVFDLGGILVVAKGVALVPHAVRGRLKDFRVESTADQFLVFFFLQFFYSF